MSVCLKTLLPQAVSILVWDEDDPRTVHGVAEAIEEYQSVVIACSSAAAVLFTLQHNTVDVVILNFQRATDAGGRHGRIIPALAPHDLPRVGSRAARFGMMALLDIQCDLAQQGQHLPHCWEHTVGSCHAPLALRADWQAQLKRYHAELAFHRIVLRNSPPPRSVSIQRIDERHVNTRRTWLALGRPEYLCSRMVAQLDGASCLRDEPCTWAYADRSTYLHVEVPLDGVASVSVRFHTH